MKKALFLITVLYTFQTLSAQKSFTRKDSLQGGLRPERSCFDVQRYDLNIKIDIEKKFIVGYNAITFKVVQNSKKIQIDLFPNMQVDSIVFHSQKLKTKREYNALFITFPTDLQAGNEEQLYFYYSGYPIIAKRAPWDGGFVFSNDKQGNHGLVWLAKEQVLVCGGLAKIHKAMNLIKECRLK